jgi:hypothetical protein
MAGHGGDEKCVQHFGWKVAVLFYIILKNYLNLKVLFFILCYCTSSRVQPCCYYRLYKMIRTRAG